MKNENFLSEVLILLCSYFSIIIKQRFSVCMGTHFFINFACSGLKMCMWSRGLILVVRRSIIFQNGGLENVGDVKFQKAVRGASAAKCHVFYIIVKIFMSSTSLDVYKMLHTFSYYLGFKFAKA